MSENLSDRKRRARGRSAHPVSLWSLSIEFDRAVACIEPPPRRWIPQRPVWLQRALCWSVRVQWLANGSSCAYRGGRVGRRLIGEGDVPGRVSGAEPEYERPFGRRGPESRQSFRLHRIDVHNGDSLSATVAPTAISLPVSSQFMTALCGGMTSEVVVGKPAMVTLHWRSGTGNGESRPEPPMSAAAHCRAPPAASICRAPKAS